MKRSNAFVKAALATLFTTLMLLSTQVGSFAASKEPAAAPSASIGVVDFQKIIQGYTKAKDFATLDGTKRQELATLRKSLADQLKEAEKATPVEKQALKDKLNEQFATKVKEYNTWASTEDQKLTAAINTAINTVAKEQILGIILSKSAVFQGGADITEKVVTSLNK